MSGIGDLFLGVGDWFGDAYDSALQVAGDAYDTLSQGAGDLYDFVSDGVGHAIDKADATLSDLFAPDAPGAKPTVALTDRLVRGGAVGRPGGGLDVLDGAHMLSTSVGLGSFGKGYADLQFGTSALDPQAYGNSFDGPGDADARPTAGLGVDLGPLHVGGIDLTPRLGLFTPPNGSLFGVYGVRVAGTSGDETFSLRSDRHEALAPTDAGVAPPGYLDTTASWSHAFDKTSSMSFDVFNRHFDTDRDWLRFGVSSKTAFGSDTQAQLGVEAVGSSVGSATGDLRFGPRVEASVTDPTLFGSDVLGGMFGLGFGSYPGPDAKPGVDHLYGHVALDLDTPSTESYVDVHGGVALGAAGGDKGQVNIGVGSGVVVTRDPTEVTLGAFLDTRTDLPSGDTRVGFGPALNINWSAGSELSLGWDILGDAIRLGVRTDF